MGGGEEKALTDVHQREARFVFRARQLAVLVLIKQSEVLSWNVAEPLSGEESVLVPVKEVEAGVVLFQRDLSVAVRIEHLKDKARARHYVEFTLGNGAVLIQVERLKAVAPFLL